MTDTDSLVTVTYVHLTRITPDTPVKAPSVAPKPSTTQRPMRGDIVEYISKAGRRGEYRVISVNDTGTHVVLRRYNARDQGFVVAAAMCRYLRKTW